MATIDSSSTLAEVLAAYDDNASYAEDDSETKAAAFVTACRVLLRRVPKRMAHGGQGAEEIEIDPSAILAERAEAERWLRLKRQAAVASRHFTFQNSEFRG